LLKKHWRHIEAVKVVGMNNKHGTNSRISKTSMGYYGHGLNLCTAPQYFLSKQEPKAQKAVVLPVNELSNEQLLLNMLNDHQSNLFVPGLIFILSVPPSLCGADDSSLRDQLMMRSSILRARSFLGEPRWAKRERMEKKLISLVGCLLGYMHSSSADSLS
jgi:hypothetical protein